MKTKESESAIFEWQRDWTALMARRIDDMMMANLVAALPVSSDAKKKALIPKIPKRRKR